MSCTAVATASMSGGRPPLLWKLTTTEMPSAYRSRKVSVPIDQDCDRSRPARCRHVFSVNGTPAETSASDVTPCLVVRDLVELLEAEGVLLESAKGPIPNVAELVAGEPIRGSWWGHPASHEIFAAINRLADSPDVARMRLVNHKVTLVHRRLWPVLLRLSSRFDDAALLVVTQEHTPSGAHRAITSPLHEWVSADVLEAAARLNDADALRMLPRVLRRQTDTTAPE
jgi:hypothetical protein